MTTKHTPGSWFICDYEENNNQVAITDETATRYIAVIDNMDEMDEANAHLIAAAPELLEALEGMMEMHAPRGGQIVWDGPYDAARAAIAKAKGEA